MTNNTNTQAIASIINRIAAALDPKQVTASVHDDSKKAKRPRYFLDMLDVNGMYASAPVMVDTDDDGNLTLWVRPRGGETELHYSASSVVLEDVQPLMDELRTIQREQGTPKGLAADARFDTYTIA